MGRLLVQPKKPITLKSLTISNLILLLSWIKNVTPAIKGEQLVASPRHGVPDCAGVFYLPPLINASKANECAASVVLIYYEDL